MFLWRITRKPFLARALEGLGAKQYGGRWNSKGTAVLYASQSLELAVLESLVHLDIDLLPKDTYQIGFELEDAFIAPVVKTLPPNWDAQPPYVPAVQETGDSWVRAGSSLGLRVPASVLPTRCNVLLNPAHPDMHRLREIERGPLPWPARVVEFLDELRKSGRETKTSRKKK